MKKLILNIILSTISVLVYSQDVSFTADAPSRVQTGTPFYIQYSLKASKKGSNFEYPQMKNFSILNVSTSQSSSSSVTIINGRMKSNNSITVTWYLTVEAKKTGTYTIAPATAKVSGKIYKSNSLVITVSKGKPISNSVQQQNQNFDLNNTAEESVNTKDLFLNLTTNKTNVYVGEPVYAYCQMFSRYDVNIQEFNPSTFDNFWIKDIKMPGSVKAQRVRLNNRTYLSAVLDKKVIFPQKSGTLTIKPYNATFQLYDGWGFPSGTKKVVSNRKVIKVKPLPTSKPASFEGAVGNFSLSSSVDKRQINVNDAFTYSITVSGTGNFGLFDIPSVSLSKSFEAMEPENKDNLSVTSEGVKGSSTVKYSFIARVPGKYKIPKIEFSYFDPAKAKYITLKTDTLTITVAGDTSNTGIGGQNQIVRNKVTELGNDIRFIKTNKTDLRIKNDFLFGKNSFWLSFIVPFVIFLLLIIILRKKIKENSDIKFVKYKKADKISQKRLKNAKKYMKNNEQEKFYEEVSKALWGYVSDKLSIPLADLTRDTVVDTLKKNNIEAQMIDDFVKVIDTCEIVRFAPSVSENQEQELYNQASNVIMAFEKNIFKNKVKH